MEFGPYQIQIFVSLALILGASLIALICDYLKGHNEQLRELALELKVRREEEHKLMSVLTAQNAQLQAPAAAVQGAATIQSNAALLDTHSENLLSPEALATLPEHQRALSRAAAPAVRSASLAARAMATPVEQKRAVSTEAAAVMHRGAMKAAAGASPVTQTVSQTAAPRQQIFLPDVFRPEVSRPAEILHEVVAVASARSAATAGTTSTAAKKDWNSLLSAQRSHTVPGRQTKPPAPPEQSGLLDAVMAATNTSRSAAAPSPALAAAFQTPTGFQAASVLNKLIEGRRPVSGLVVSIGVDACERDPQAVRSAIESLLQPGELGGPTGPDEFVLLLPAEQGARAQRRLSRIAQQLWDFQLGSLSQQGVQFSWGGVEVRHEPLDEAVSSAAERMRDTRRGRQFLAAHGAGSR